MSERINVLIVKPKYLLSSLKLRESELSGMKLLVFKENNEFFIYPGNSKWYNEMLKQADGAISGTYESIVQLLEQA